MKKTNKSLLIVTTLTAVASCAVITKTEKTADSLDNFFSPQGVTITSASYPTAESSHQMLKNQDIVGVNKFLHKRQLSPTDKQVIVRMNKDTYYSFSVIDVSKGATVTIPPVPEGKYVSVHPITEDHRIQPMFYGSGTFELSTHSGSLLYVAVRLDSTIPEEEAHKIQDQMVIIANSNKRFKAEAVNQESFEAVEKQLKAQMPAIVKRDGKEATFGMFTAPTDESDKLFTQEKYEVGAAIGWGGAQLIDNIYEVSGNYPADSCHQATLMILRTKRFGL